MRGFAVSTGTRSNQRRLFLRSSLMYIFVPSLELIRADFVVLTVQESQL